MQHSSPAFQLTHHPIALVLCQIRFSALMGMETTYLADIQARLRRLDFKVNASGTVAQIVMTPQGPQTQTLKRNEFQNIDRTESVVVAPDFVTYQSSRYTCFQDFLERMLQVTDQISDVTNGLTVERLGLRYINVVVPSAEETWQSYVQPGLRGISSPAFTDDTDEQVHQIATQTTAGGAMIIRVLSHPHGIPLPPDLAASHLSLPTAREVVRGHGAAVIDIDHYCSMRPTEYSTTMIRERLWNLKRIVLEVWKDRVVATEALERWA